MSTLRDSISSPTSLYHTAKTIKLHSESHSTVLLLALLVFFTTFSVLRIRANEPWFPTFNKLYDDPKKINLRSIVSLITNFRQQARTILSQTFVLCVMDIHARKDMLMAVES